MLMKLMKHEFRATGRVMLPMFALMLAAAVGGNLAIYRLMDARSNALNALGAILLAAFGVIMLAAAVAVVALMIQRFYMNLLRDEVYLMMTLPVSVHVHILSKLFVSLIWFVATAVCAVLAMFVLAFNLDVAQAMGEGLRALMLELRVGDRALMGDVMLFAGYGAEFVLLLLLGMACGCLQLYAAMAAGHSFTHHKGLMSVLAFLLLMGLTHGAGYVLGWMLTLVRWEGVQMWMDAQSMDMRVHLMMLSAMAATALGAVVYELIASYFLRKHLNLN